MEDVAAAISELTGRTEGQTRQAGSEGRNSTLFYEMDLSAALYAVLQGTVYVSADPLVNRCK